MNKKICIALSTMLIVFTGSFAFAAEPANITSSAVDVSKTTAAAVEAPTVIPNMEFSKNIISLTLADAMKKMTTDSPSKELIDLHKRQALNIAEEHIIGVQGINDTLRGDYTPSGTKFMKNLEVYLVEFSKAQAEPNYQAELNKLNLDTFKKYYDLKHAEDSQRIATENYELKKTLLSNTQKKFELGTVSKMDVLQAESALNTAKDELFTAQNGLKASKMSFNTFMGYDVMQSVNLTDKLSKVELPKKSLEDSIKEALINRNDIRAVAHGIKAAELGLAIYQDYPPNSYKNLSAKASLVKAQKDQKDTILMIETEVRNKYIAMKQKYDAITSGEKNVTNAKESVRLAQLQYDVGMATLTTINDAQILLNKAELGLSQNLLDYNMAVSEYNYASGIGTTTVPIA